MGIEVKLRLPDAESHSKVAKLLSSFHVKTYLQENIFFDGAKKELSSQRAVLRLRFYDGDSRCVVSLKAKAVMKDGVSRVEEDEEELDPWIGRACVADCVKILEVENGVLRRSREEFGVGEMGFVCLGEFKNVRNVYEWNGGKLELDETVFEFGTCYGIECEPAETERGKRMIEYLLKENGIRCQYFKESKFGIFRAGIVP